MPETLVMVGVRHLGRDIALHFAERGWEVVCAARTQEEVEAVAHAVDAAGGHGVAVVCDLEDPTTLDVLLRPRIDLCIAAQAAGGRFGPLPLLEMEDGELDRAVGPYLHGAWNLLRVVGRKLVEQRAGTFIQIGTSSGVRTREGFAALGAVQHGLRALVQVAAREWRPHDVHVAFVPVDGPIESDKTREWLTPSGVERSLPPSEIARACEYLHRQHPRAWTHELLLRPGASDWTAPT
jgi:NAD(P)-dependent dehydrogenase (short-subunit alcohol dehydrogenase family)